MGSTGVRREKITIGTVISGLIGLVCALALCLIFYSTMVYQLGDKEPGAQQQTPPPTPMVLTPGESAGNLFPGALMALRGAYLTEEKARDEQIGGQVCRVITRTYQTSEGEQAAVVSATPAAYLERIVSEQWTPQLITGYVLAGLDAVYALRGEEALLAARDGDFVYMLRCPAGEQTAYTLGVSAYLERAE